MSVDVKKLLSRTTLYKPNKLIKPKSVNIPGLKKTKTTAKKTTKKKTPQTGKNRYNQTMTAGARSGVGRLQKIKGMA
jgi:hypothetical protein